jgi:hypothetical protein
MFVDSRYKSRTWKRAAQAARKELTGGNIMDTSDRWYAETVKPLIKGKTFMARYADDAIIGCEKKEDADRIMKVLALRFAKYSSDHTPGKDEAGRLHQTW